MQFICHLFISSICVEEHHDAEEEVYFPWIKSKAEYPEKEFGISHESLSTEMEGMKEACEAICQRRGRDCVVEIATLKRGVPAFVSNMRAHLREEEEDTRTPTRKLHPGGGGEDFGTYRPGWRTCAHAEVPARDTACHEGVGQARCVRGAMRIVAPAG
jgi:hypothetical protein